MNLELVDPSGKVQSRAEREVSLPPGSSTLKVPLPALSGGSAQKEQGSLLWSRLRYSIVPVPVATPPSAAVEGTISAGAIAPQIFDLQVAGAGVVRPGARTTLRVRATHPMTGRPVPRVTVQASLDVDNDDDKPSRSRTAVTGRDGFATLEFVVPKDLDEDEYQLGVTVTGTLGGLSAEANGDLPICVALGVVSVRTSLSINGQTVHMRLLAFGEDKKALADQPVTIEIKDPEDTVEYAVHLRTSRFGIAAADWQIPANLRLGDYGIRAKFDDDRYEGAQGWATVKISRYELPTFAVTAKPDRAYYLPGQNAEVEVRADYLFGKPVRRGHVRVVREDHREWNYREQKWDVDEGDVYEGDTDDNGRYVVHVDLTDDHDELADNDYQRFRDLRLAAYFIDASTRRTEQRRFDVRISKEPVHVYIIENSYSLVSSGLPVESISTDYADGTPRPATCGSVGSQSRRRIRRAARWKSLRHVHTNRFGLAKVTGLRVPDEPDSADIYLDFRATDCKGDRQRLGRPGVFRRPGDSRHHEQDPLPPR